MWFTDDGCNALQPTGFKPCIRALVVAEIMKSATALQCNRRLDFFFQKPVKS